MNDDPYTQLQTAFEQLSVNLEKFNAEWMAMVETLHLHALLRETRTPAQRRREAKREIREWKYRRKLRESVRVGAPSLDDIA